MSFISFPAVQESQFTTEVAAKEAQLKGGTPEQLKSMGIDPNNPTQAAERARQMGATEQQIQEAIKESQ